MPQPPVYNRQFSFTDWQGSNPADPLPSAQHEIELNAIKVTLDAILGNIALIQRDDGRLANLSVGADQLEVSIRLGVNPPTAWAASTAYVVNDTVVYNVGSRSELWLALSAHTSTANFDTDSLTSGYWRMLADFATIALDASATVFDGTTSGLAATNVQDAIDELDATLDTLGTMATQNANAVAVTGGTISGIADLAIADGGTGASSAATALAALGGVSLSGGDQTMTGGLTASNSLPFFRLNETDQAVGDDEMRMVLSSGVAYYQGTPNGKLHLTGFNIGDLTELKARFAGVDQDIIHSGLKATQAKAEAGTDDTDYMTALTTAQALAASGASGFSTALFHITDEKASATAGGTFTSGAWQKRTLNTTRTNEISGASVASSVVTLPAGTYHCEIRSPGNRVRQHQAKLRNTSDSTDTLIGSSEESESVDFVTTQSFISGRFTIAASKTFELQHQCSSTRATDGFGTPVGYGVTEVYADAKFWKVG